MGMESVFKEIRHACDPTNLSEDERLHVPLIEIPDGIPSGMMFPVTVKVGQAPHVVKTTHYIQFVDLYADQTFLSRITFTPTLPKPKATFFLVLDEPVTLRAVSFCNRHGFWESERLAMVEAHPKG